MREEASTVKLWFCSLNVFYGLCFFWFEKTSFQKIQQYKARLYPLHSIIDMSSPLADDFQHIEHSYIDDNPQDDTPINSQDPGESPSSPLKFPRVTYTTPPGTFPHTPVSGLIDVLQLASDTQGSLQGNYQGIPSEITPEITQEPFLNFQPLEEPSLEGITLQKIPLGRILTVNQLFMNKPFFAFFKLACPSIRFARLIRPSSDSAKNTAVFYCAQCAVFPPSSRVPPRSNFATGMGFTTIRKCIDHIKAFAHKRAAQLNNSTMEAPHELMGRRKRGQDQIQKAPSSLNGPFVGTSAATVDVPWKLLMDPTRSGRTGDPTSDSPTAKRFCVAPSTSESIPTMESNTEIIVNIRNVKSPKINDTSTSESAADLSERCDRIGCCRSMESALKTYIKSFQVLPTTTHIRESLEQVLPPVFGWKVQNVICCRLGYERWHYVMAPKGTLPLWYTCGASLFIDVRYTNLHLGPRTQSGWMIDSIVWVSPSGAIETWLQSSLPQTQ